mmetsp:Transcript_26020/g.45866  ORF Transcript_26020/g.45866 Transcript_26020/m.45866 type:complete len:82 (+) Transcript_26020:173-418(+)
MLPVALLFKGLVGGCSKRDDASSIGGKASMGGSASMEGKILDKDAESPVASELFRILEEDGKSEADIGAAAAAADACWGRS